MKRILYLVGLLFCIGTRASSIEMLLSGNVISFQDSQTGSKVIQKGGSALAKVSVNLIVGGAQENEVRKSLMQSVPRAIKGWIEARQSNSGRLVQSVPVTFSSRLDSIKCKKSSSGDKTLCQMSYQSDNNNYVEVPAKMAGNYSLGLKLKAPQSETPIYSKNNSSLEFSVEGQPSRAFASFAGLPEN